MKDYGLNAFRVLSARLALIFFLTVVCGVALGTMARAADLSVVDAASSLNMLSASDAQRYAAGFAAMHRGDFTAGQGAIHGLNDPCLIGRLEAVRLLHTAYRASFPELKLWLDRNGDLPEAERVYDLAMRRKPVGAAAPPAPLSLGAGKDAPYDSASLPVSVRGQPSKATLIRETPGRQAARNAFYRGDLDQALVLASRSGERWIAGLSALRLKRYPQALQQLSELTADAKQTPWARAAAAYWASRAAVAVGDPVRAHELLKLASRSPDTFYGLIAGRELEQQGAKTAQVAALNVDLIGDVVAAAAVDSGATSEFAHTDARARRAAALMQIGLVVEAAEELRLGLTSSSPEAREAFTSLALRLNAPFGAYPDVAKAGWARFDAGHFPTPLLHPQGGFTIDKALVYALVRQESRFNPDVISGSGAYGLMQLTADTAARTAGDDKLRRNPSALKDPALNLRLGQAYVTKLLASLKGDVVRAVAAYNCGPGVIQRLLARMGQDVDSLLLVESMPSGQTRDYVQRVMAGYWIYRQIFGQDSSTLDAAAAGAATIASADL